MRLTLCNFVRGQRKDSNTKKTPRSKCKKLGFYDFCLWKGGFKCKWWIRWTNAQPQKNVLQNLYVQSVLYVHFGEVNFALQKLKIFTTLFIVSNLCWNIMESSDSLKPYCGKLKIWVGSNERANMVKQCMEVDDELQPNKLRKEI